MISKNLNYITNTQFTELIRERDILAKMLVNLKAALGKE